MARWDRFTRVVVRRLIVPSPAETAQPLDGLSLPRRRALQRLLRQGVVREADGRYWPDGAAYAHWSAARLRRVLWILLVVAVAMVVLTVLGFFRA
ncbi:MAG TPA: hypothetical protein VFS20_27465 [Longimicrobium sp.]|nr:hypothetical protein [Longimicrobium sp.]